MNRRQALRWAALAGSGSLAGCSSVLGPSGTVLGRIEVINSSRVANRIRILVIREEETLLDRTISLSPIDSNDGAAARIIEPLWSEAPGQYTVKAIHLDESGDRESLGNEYTFTQQDYERYYSSS